MLLILLLLIPLIGIFLISTIYFSSSWKTYAGQKIGRSYSLSTLKQIKIIALSTSIINLFVSLIVFLLFNSSSNQFQFVQEYHRISSFDFYLGVDGISIYFVLLTTIIMPIALLSNWSSISENVKSYVVVILLLETLLLAVFLVLSILHVIFIVAVYTMYILYNLFLYKVSFKYSEKLILLSIICITVLPIKTIFAIFNLNQYYFIIVLFTSLFSITLTFIYKKGKLPDVYSIFTAISLSMIVFIFIHPLFSYLLYKLPLKDIIILISNILLVQGSTHTLSMNSSQNNDSLSSAVDTLSSTIENTSDLDEEEIPRLKRELSLLHKKGTRVLSNIRRFYTKGSPIEQAIEINKQKMIIARRIDILSGNTNCTDNHKKSDLYKYVESLSTEK